MVYLKHHDLVTHVTQVVHSWEDTVDNLEIQKVYDEQFRRDHSGDSVYYVDGREGVL